MPQLVRSNKDERRDLISLADALRECSRGKRRFSSKDEKLCGGKAVVFVVYYPMPERAILLAVVVYPR